MTEPNVSTDLNDYGFSTEIRVRLSETDAVGIVFFGSFASYFDVGRMDYLAHLNLDRFDGQIRDLIPGAVIHQQVRFKAPSHYNDILVMHVRISNIGKTSYTFNFLVNNKRDRRLVATGTMTMVWLNDTFDPVRVPDEFRAVVSAFEAFDD